MNGRKLASIALLVTLFSLLGVALGVYGHTQRALSLEGNNLYSGGSVAVNAPGTELESLLRSAGVSARIFQALPEGDSVRAVIETGRPDPLPLHSGRQFRAADSRAALVGADVPVSRHRGETTFVFRGESYPVVGLLGLRPHSLASDTVLLRDPELFDNTAQSRVIVDGSSIEDVVGGRMEFTSAAAAGAGTDRRTNIDFVSPVLLRFGWILTVVGAVTTGLLAASHARRLHRVLFHLGSRRPRVLIRGTVRLLAGMAPPPLLIFGVAAAIAGPMHPGGALLVFALAPAALIAGVFVAASAWFLWRPHPWG